MKHTLLASLCLGAAAALAASAATAQSSYPDRPITMIVPWGAGGGTDAVARIMANLLEADLGVPVNVVNRTGGAGVVGHSAIATAAPDGYTLGVMTVEIAMMHWQGLTELTHEDFTIFALVNSDGGGLMVSSNSPYETAEALLEDIRTSPPGTFRASGTGQGGIWHLGLAGWLLSEDIDPGTVPWIPSDGSAPAITDMVAGGVDLVTSSTAEGRALIEAGRVRPLAHMDDERLSLFPDVPTLAEATGSDWTIAAWRGVVGPAGIPDEITEILVPAIERAYNDAAYQEFMDGRGFGVMFAGPDDASDFIAQADEEFGRVMEEAGLLN